MEKILANTIEDLKEQGLTGSFEDLIITRSVTQGCGSWSMSCVRYKEGIGWGISGIASNRKGAEIPDNEELKDFFGKLKGLDAYKVISEVERLKYVNFSNAMISSIASALSNKLMN